MFLFVLALMAKSMPVTLPFLLLLLDYWPLQRYPNFRLDSGTVARLTFEKWPFFLLAAVSCLVAFFAQLKLEAVTNLQQFPLQLRVANALISYGQYLAKTVWPCSLAIFYPLPKHLSWVHATVLTAAVVLGAISWFSWRLRQQHPCLLVGWLWFLGTLVPVIGLVQVGGVAMADRFTYFPLVGIFIALTFGVRDLAARFRLPKISVIAAVALIFAACLTLTENQLRYWRDSERLLHSRACGHTRQRHCASQPGHGISG